MSTGPRNFVFQMLLIAVSTAVIAQHLVLPWIMNTWFPWSAEMQKIENHRAGGTMALLAERLNAVGDNEQLVLIAQLQLSFSHVIAVRNLEDLTLDPAELERLEAGETIFDYDSRGLYKLLENRRRAVVMENIEVHAPHIVEQQSTLIDATVYLLEQHLLAYPPSQRRDQMAKLSRHFAFPLLLQPLAELPVTDEERRRLRVGELVTRETAESRELENLPDYIFKKLPDSDLAFYAGPITPGVWEIQNSAMKRYFSLMGAMVVLLLALWLIPSWQSTKSLLRAADAFGRGEFSARAKIVWASNLNDLARLFNRMAEKIQILFNSNKMLTHAVSHELRTPLTRIEFALEILRGSDNEAGRGKQFERIDAALKELNNMTSEMLLYARFDRDKPDFNLQRVDLNRWILSEQSKWQYSIKGVKVTVTPAVIPAIVAIENYYLSRAVDNLVRNAVKYASHRVHVSVEMTNGICAINVENDGPPIAAEDRDRVFEPFVRLDESRTRDSGGAGLGLAIVRQIVTWHHAKIRIGDSELGGAKFAIYFEPR